MLLYYDFAFIHYNYKLFTLLSTNTIVTLPEITYILTSYSKQKRNVKSLFYTKIFKQHIIQLFSTYINLIEL